VKPSQCITKYSSQSGRQNPPGTKVVAVGESPRDRQNLRTIEKVRLIQQLADVDFLSIRAGTLPGLGRFLVAIGPGSS
jgi:hypothetical protein